MNADPQILAMKRTLPAHLKVSILAIGLTIGFDIPTADQDQCVGLGALVISTSRPDRAYAISMGKSRLLVTSDRGASWTGVGIELPFYVQDAVVIDPRDADSLYLGSVGARSDGVFQSTDAGHSWQPRHDGIEGSIVYALAVNPSNPAIIYGGIDEAVVRTVDGGMHWSSILRLGRSDSARKIIVSTDDPNLLLIGSVRTLMRSRDGGSSWDEITSGLQADCMTWALMNVPGDPKRIYVARETYTPVKVNGKEASQFGVALCESEDTGESWRRVQLPVTGDPTVFNLAASPHGRAIFAATAEGLFRSADGGSSWERCLIPGAGKKIGQVASSVTDPDYVLVAERDSGAVFRSTDAGKSWSATAGLCPALAR